MSIGPKIIFLQGMTNPILPFDEITWCKDKINDDDIKYIRYDIYEKIFNKLKEITDEKSSGV